MKRLNLTASLNQIDLNVTFWICDLPLIKCLTSAACLQTL